jgi:hypothetical protein
MTNIAWQDKQGGSIMVYTANKDLPRLQRIKLALSELESVGNINIFLFKRRKLRLIKSKNL